MPAAGVSTVPGTPPSRAGMHGFSAAALVKAGGRAWPCPTLTSANPQVAKVGCIVVKSGKTQGVHHMRTSILIFAAAALTVSSYAAPPTYKVTGDIKIGGGGAWDYVFIDSTNHRLYVSHGNQT